MDKSFSEYLLGLGVVTHYSEPTREGWSKSACGRVKGGAFTDHIDMVTCRQCNRILSRWRIHPELANQYRFNQLLTR
jgi:hypothetical protein